MTASAIYEGQVRHRRFAEREHEFSHPMAMHYLDLDELPRLLGGRLLARRPGLVRFRRRDYLGDPAVPLAEAVRALVAERTGDRPEGAVRLLTHLRTFGHCFNPVSFYYCHERDGRLAAMVAEVTNTPWGERHAYVLAARGEPVVHGELDKRLHVSPFMGMDQRYEWRATAPGETISVHISSREGGERAFDATLALRRAPFTRRALARITARYPAATLRVLALIYGHAAGLWLRGVGVRSHPEQGAGVTSGQRTARRLVLAILETIHEGELTVVDGTRRRHFGSGAPRAVVEVRSPRVWTALLTGSRGLAESYADGLWETPDLPAVVRIAARNVQGLDEFRRRLTPLREPFQRGRALLRRNTPTRSRHDIAAHYDLGNDLFELMLDPTMMYSCALFERPGATLAEAAVAKLELVCDKLDLGPRDHVLEIGTGWGGFAIHAARTRGCRVTTTTLSAEQRDLALERVRRAGLEDRVEVLRRDYRELDGTYDKLVSLEMIEAVGWKDFGTFFAACSERLAANGVMLLQAITMDDRAYKVERASKSFIRTHIFPNGCLPSNGVIARCVAARTDMRAVHLEDMTPHYAQTLRHWRANFERAAEVLEARGYDERFRRMWRMYLAYCEGGFAERRIGLVQTVLAKPRWSGSVPTTRAVGSLSSAATG